MENSAHRAIAIVGVGAILPDAPNVEAFWENVKTGRYSISEVQPERWDPQLYYDPDPAAPEKTYSKIGGWVREYDWEPIKWHFPIPPKVSEAMDEAQQWALACTRQALNDYGYPARPLDPERTAVILGNAMGGEKHYLTALRLQFPEYARQLEKTPSFSALSEELRRDITRQLHDRVAQRLPEVTEDSMPGELANCIAGRIANALNFRGPNYVVDAACASAIAAISSATEGLIERDFDVAITGGIDRNMGASTFIKFCKIGALSATGTRPYAEGADGFVMGEGAVILMLKRLADAERDKDKIYAVIRGIGGASDGKGKGITAPNPIGQRKSIERAWKSADLSPATATLIEGHGTSTRVGDVVEVESLLEVLKPFSLRSASVALGSVKSNLGHLKGAAGAAGLLKASLALKDKVLPPSVHCERPNPDIHFKDSPLFVNTELRHWSKKDSEPRRVGVSAFGFGGTNFHAVLEEYVPNLLTGGGKRMVSVPEIPVPERTTMMSTQSSPPYVPPSSPKAPLRGALVLGANSEKALYSRLLEVERNECLITGTAAPKIADLKAETRIAIDFGDPVELREKLGKARKAFEAGNSAGWKALRAQGIFQGNGKPTKTAFLYTGQGSQYINMISALRTRERCISDTFAEADEVMAPLLGCALSKYIFIDESDASAVAKAEEALRQTAITQPAVLATDIALTRLLAEYGVRPDMVIGHSLGEYAALVTAGALPLADALEAVSARGREMTRVAVEDNGRMAAIFAPIEEIERILKTVTGYVVIANLNSSHQAVIGGTTRAVDEALELFTQAGYNAVPLPVSHAFHTSIVAPASEPLQAMLRRLRLKPPELPIISNVSGEFYPCGPDSTPETIELLGKQIASPVQFVKGLQTLYTAGARVFVEVGPKRALQSFADDVFEKHPDVLALSTNNPKLGEVVSFNHALCGLYAAGLGMGVEDMKQKESPSNNAIVQESWNAKSKLPEPSVAPPTPPNGDRITELGHYFADVLERGWQLYGRGESRKIESPVVITGAAVGLPGTERIFDDANIARILGGQQLIDTIPTKFRRAMLDKHITRLVKSETGDPRFETITELSDVIKLAARGGVLDLEKDFGISAERVAALDRSTALAIGAGMDALRDAGIPLVMRYKSTSKGTRLPDRWCLPDCLRDDTGVIFASAFPGFDAFAGEITRYHEDRALRQQLSSLQTLRARAREEDLHSTLIAEIDRQIHEAEKAVSDHAYVFDRRFLFRALSMGHSQFAELTGARGPNTQVNAACASTTQAIAIAEDWIRAGRCRRVIVVSADDATSDTLIEWLGAGFLATGAAATDDVVENAATPFDRRRHGMIMGMGAAALVVESEQSARERGLRPICEVLGAISANSAFHGTRLDVDHISSVMESLLRQAEDKWGISRTDIAPRTVFVSHETYTPARGGSAAAEIHALRRVFGGLADRIVIANTKGLTGHAMGTGVEDVVAIKALESACVPPVANFKEVDPELGSLNLSKGGIYPIEYALRLGAGFGSQIAMTLLHWVPTANGVRPHVDELGYTSRLFDEGTWSSWLKDISGQAAPKVEVVQRTLRVCDDRRASMTSAIEQTVTEKEQAQSVPTIGTDTPIDPRHVSSQQGDEGTTTAEINPEFVRTDDVRSSVLALVAEKTGYPTEMLDLDLDLEADLGIDTVKQAELFANIREAYGIRRDDTIRLRDFPTLAHVIRFVNERRAAPTAVTISEVTEPPTKQSIPIASPSPTATNNSASSTNVGEDGKDSVTEQILSLVVEKTGYPREMLDLDLDLEADLGVDTVKQAELFSAIREIYNIPRDENRKLRDYPTLAHVIAFVHEKRPNLNTPVLSQPVAVCADTVADLTYDDPAVRKMVLEIVAEKTGYPEDMLDLDLDLEADLGIDTVKQAEMFASVRTAFNIPRDANLRLRDFPTLGHVIKFARERRGRVGTSVPDSTSVEHSASGPTEIRPAPLISSFDAANLISRRVPVPVLAAPLNLCKQTDVKIQSGTRVVVMPDKSGVAEDLCRLLRARGAEPLLLEQTVTEDDIAMILEKWKAEGPVCGVFWLPALDIEEPIEKMKAHTWHDSLKLRVKLLYATMRSLYAEIENSGTFLISATRLGGQHGYNEDGASAPMGGAVVGFTKTYKRERENALVKAIDFETHCPTSEIADLLVQEALRDSGTVEMGYKDGLRWLIGLQEESVQDGKPGLSLGKNSVFLITGAAGSIVSAITSDLASASGGTFHLLDLAPEPDATNPDLKRLANDKENLKRDIFARIQARGERATPALVEKELAELERAVSALSAIDAVERAGGTAHYYSVNLTDPAAVTKVIETVRKNSGHIDVLLHAAGLERSHLLRDKDRREFDLVFDVKADGWFNLLRAIGDMPLSATVAFSSIAGRFGNAGQADYSAANDLLCKLTSNLRASRPSTRGIVVDWTAWAGIGMATRGSIPKMMELAGIDMLAPEAGIPWIRRELIMGGTAGEVVVAKGLGVLLGQREPSDRADSTVDLEATMPMINRINASNPQEVTLETTLDPKAQPFLHDHRIEGTPVLPGVMGIEAFAEAATLLAPGWRVRSIRDVHFLAPFKFYRDEPRTLKIKTRVRPANNRLTVDCTLVGYRTLVGQVAPQENTHFTAKVLLDRCIDSQADSPLSRIPELNGQCVTAEEIYQIYFHGPAYRVLDHAWINGDSVLGRMALRLPDDHYPSSLKLLANPRLIELCFQAAGLWEIVTQQKMGLPESIEEIRFVTPAEHLEQLFAVVHKNSHDASFDAEIVDGRGNRVIEIVGYRTVELPIAVKLDALKSMQPLAA